MSLWHTWPNVTDTIIINNNIPEDRREDNDRQINSRHKTIANKLMYMYNNDTQNYTFCRLQLVVETFRNSTQWTKQSKFNRSPQSCWGNELENDIKSVGK